MGEPEREPSDRKRLLGNVQIIAQVMELPFIMVAGVVIGGGAGYWLDAHFKTSPLWTLLLGILGFAGPLREILRRIPKDDADK
jgi:F0F1-type ATP synthase assembly protein I